MERKERLAEEFELGSEEEALRDYAHVTSVISINYSLITDELSKLGDFQQGLAIDVGTGLGNLAREIAKRYPELKVIGIDISGQAINESAKKAKEENLNNASFQIGDVHSLAFQDASVDLVVSHGLMHHLKDLPKFFSEIYRILKPDAVSYLTDLRRDAPTDLIKEVEANLPSSQGRAFINSINAAYTPEELIQVLEKSGIRSFEVSGQRFSRATIIKNIDKLRKINSRKADYTNLSQTVLIRK